MKGQKRLILAPLCLLLALFISAAMAGPYVVASPATTPETPVQGAAAAGQPGLLLDPASG